MKNAGAIRFRPTLWPTFATLVLLPTLVVLGFWQLDRAEQKRSILAEYDLYGSKTMTLNLNGTKILPRYQRVRIRGRYDKERQFLLDAMPGSSGAGFHVLSLFRPDGSDTALLVDRGWIKGSGDRSILPKPAVPQGVLMLEGRLATLPQPGIALQGEEENAGVWPRLMLFPTMDELEQAAGTGLYPMVLWLDPKLPGGFEREWRPINAAPDRHIAYAVQWFGLALALLMIFIFVNLERERGQENQRD